ncbi:MAG: hypothetical protein M3296_08035 [Actinomycetota bacterium]|nr:hypothetical protein [Actinomycetota bacterium]
MLDSHRLCRALAEAELRRLGDRVGLSELMRRHPRSRGIAVLRELLRDGRLDADVTRSELELAFHADRESFENRSSPRPHPERRGLAGRANHPSPAAPRTARR